MDAVILRALKVVIDPELGIDIVSLGLVYGAERLGDVARVTMTMTSPACPMGSMLTGDAKEAVEAMVPGVREAEVDLVFEPRWTPERISDDARAQLGLPALSRNPALHPAAPEGTTMTTTLDVRTLMPRERHPLIFKTFDSLKPGDSFELVNDHDPKPLYYHFEAERPGQLQWSYVEEGPQVWRVRIARTAA